MASSFIGSRIRVTLTTDDRALEGVLQDIDPAKGQLVLEDVTVSFSNGRTSHLSAQVVMRENVKALEMIAQREATAGSLSSSDQTQLAAKPKTPAKKKRQSSRTGTTPQYNGSEADDSAAYNNATAPVKTAKRSASRKKALAVVPPTSNAFEQDFDFAHGLEMFDKQRVFQEIKAMDETDPALRLVSHNKKHSMNAAPLSPGSIAKYTSKLSIHENVLDVEDSEREIERLEAMAILKNKYHHQNGPTSTLHALETDIETSELETEDDNAILYYGTESKSTAGTSKSILTADTNLPCPYLPWKDWKEVQQLANIETGPNSLQRIENAARGIATYVLQRMFKNVNKNLNAVVLCGTGVKGQCGLRTAAHLVNKGCSVTALVTSGESLPSNFEFQLRLFSAAGGKMIRTVADLPSHVDIIIDALSENDPIENKGKRKSSTLEGEAVLFANSQAAPTLSIDVPSGIDPDTGLTQNTYCIIPQRTIALGCLKRAHLSEKTTGLLALVDLGLPHVAFERASSVPWLRQLFDKDWLVECIR